MTIHNAQYAVIARPDNRDGTSHYFDVFEDVNILEGGVGAEPVTGTREVAVGQRVLAYNWPADNIGLPTVEALYEVTESGILDVIVSGDDFAPGDAVVFSASFADVPFGGAAAMQVVGDDGTIQTVGVGQVLKLVPLIVAGALAPVVADLAALTDRVSALEA